MQRRVRSGFRRGRRRMPRGSGGYVYIIGRYEDEIVDVVS